jgi:mannose-6-phosphate isomerase-like protein (cupin superfamily)
MKQKFLTLITVTALVALACIHCACAQDWMNKDAKSVTLLTDTTYVRAMVITVMPGEKGAVHSHPAHFFYALTDGKLIVHYTDGKDETYDLKKGDSGFSNPERPHRTENPGDKPIQFLLVELKEHPYQEPMKK